MSAKINIQGYLDTVNAPWGKLFYKMIWHNLEFEGKRVLDFGSGFGITADYLAAKNDVVAVEPNEEMIAHRFCENAYQQIIGGIEQLSQMQEASFDVIVCHNVLEYLENRDELFGEFKRLLKPEGFLSIVKHNKAGKIMQKAVFEYNVDEALNLLHNGDAVSVNFGAINKYENDELEKFAGGAFKINKVYGFRIFFGLQRNELKTEKDWLENMYKLECVVEAIPEFRDIAYFQHVMLKLV